MKKQIVFLLMAGVLLTFTACEAIKDALTVNVDFDVPEISFVAHGTHEATPHVAQKAPTENAVIVYQGILDVNVKEELEKQNFKMDILKSLFVQEGVLVLQMGADTFEGVNLDDYKSFKLYVDTMDNLIAQVREVDKEKGLLILSVSNADIMDLLNKDQLAVILTADALPEYNAEFVLKLKLRARAALLK